MFPESYTFTQYLPAVAVPLSATLPLRALGFCVIVVRQLVPSDEPMERPSAIVASGATLVSEICTEPFVATEKMWEMDPVCASVPLKTSVVVAAAVGEVGVVVLAPHAAEQARAAATASRCNPLRIRTPL